MNSLKTTTPFIIFIIIVILFWRGLSTHPTNIPSPLINQKMPAFKLPSLINPERLITPKDFLGHVSLLNVWATWCYACAEEHDFLMTLAHNPNVIIYGLNYKDNRTEAIQLLKEKGNPYDIILYDPSGETGMDFGVYGTPETFLIDANGIIRYKWIGPLNLSEWQKHFLPVLLQLQNENGIKK